MNDEFYIGYLDNSPPVLSKHTGRWVGCVVLLVVVLAGLAALRQTPAEPGTFEFGTSHMFEGVLLEAPLPRLRVVSPTGGSTNYLIVGSGKHGLPAFAHGADGHRVRFNGTLIQKGAARMVEMNDPSSFIVLSEAGIETKVTTEELGTATLRGELVDTKCYFGVMRPATGKVHRACAARCLSGGVPPGILVRDQDGNGVVAMLVGANDKPLDFDIGWAAREVDATGRLRLEDNMLILEAERLQLSVQP